MIPTGDTASKRLGWLAGGRPGIKRQARRRPTFGNLWFRCEETGELVYRPDLEAAQWVTPSGFHLRIAPALRFAYTFDDDRYELLPAPQTRDDPLGFTYGKSYRQALATARKATGAHDAISAAIGRIGGVSAVAVVQDFGFIAGSLSIAAGEAFVGAAEVAAARGLPLVAFTAAAGARMQESALALMQMARTTIALQLLKAAGQPYVVVLTDPTVGGVAASYAMLGDAQLVERGATVGFTGRRVIEQTIRETLPAHFQTADFVVDRGLAERVVARKDLPGVLGALLAALSKRTEDLPAL